MCFFASLREKIGKEFVIVELSGPIKISQLKELVGIQIGQDDALNSDGIQASIDFEFARDNSIVEPDSVKEVAFFPPVTGG